MLTRRQALVYLTAVPLVATTTRSEPTPVQTGHPAEVKAATVEPDEGARFEVVKIDPEGSGMDWQGHLGRVITNAERCCENCLIIIGTLGHPANKWEVGFVPGELRPLNDAARVIEAEIAVETNRLLSNSSFYVDMGAIAPDQLPEVVARVRDAYDAYMKAQLG